MEDMQQYLVSEFIEDYEDGLLGRRDLERRVIGIAGRDEGRRILAFVPRRPYRRRARAVPPPPIMGGAGLETQDVRISVKGGELLGYLARPADEGRYPALLAIHENKGLVEHIKDCARRLASAGYVALAPDLLSREGGTGKFADPNDATVTLGKAERRDPDTDDLVAALDWLAQQPQVDGSRLGVTGWCMGGGYTWRVATKAGTRIKAAVPWYGPNPPDGVENIQAPVFGIYAGLDERINAGIDDITRQMQANGKQFEKKIYPNSQHAFNNDTSPERHNPEQAKIAWNDMLSFFGKRL